MRLKKGILVTVLSAILFGIAPLITKSIYAHGMNAVGLGFYRTLLALPFLYSMVKVKHLSLTISFHELKRIVVVALFGSTLTMLFLNLAFGSLDVGTASTLHFMHPLFVTVICVVLFKERFRVKKAIPLLIALAGVCLFIDLENLNSLLGISYAIISSLTYAFYIIGIGKFNLHRINTYVLSFWTSAIVLISFLIMSLLTNSLFLPANSELLLLLLGNAIVCQVLAVTLMQLGITILGPQSASLLSLFEPITCVIAGYFFLRESLSVNAMIGCIFILLAVILHVHFEKEK